MKGIILAGGSGSRLYPSTVVVSKQLLPVYDKPMIYYPLSTLMLAGIRDVLIITTPRDKVSFENLLGDGSSLGIKLAYAVQSEPRGLPEAFTIGEAFIGDGPVCLILGDNLFFGNGLGLLLKEAQEKVGISCKALVFATQVVDPNRYGVVAFDKNFQVLSLEEKPEYPKSNYAVTGLYYFTNDVVHVVKNQRPSSRGELEITHTLIHYLEKKTLCVERLHRGFAWLDTGTHKSLLEAAHYVSVLEERQGLKVACLEEIAWRKGYITTQDLHAFVNQYKKNSYGDYLAKLLETEGELG